MDLFLAALGILLATALLALVTGRRPGISAGLSVAGCLAASALILVSATGVLLGGPGLRFEAPLSLPGGAFALGIDPLSAFFLMLLAALAIPTSVFGAGYLAAHARGRNLGFHFFLFNCMVTSIAVVVSARNALLFLVAWEAMTLSSFLLVLFEHAKEEVRAAGRRYLFASGLSGACLLALFAILGSGSGGLGFEGLAEVAGKAGPGATAVIFCLALVGFGTKAGLVPLHVWLPLAHPAAPSHVSAFMSGVLIKCGFYGLLRVLSFMPVLPPWYGLVLMALGGLTALAGILLALGQRDLKRALAYSSVENMGIVAAGIGLGLLAVALGQPALGGLAVAGVLLHLLNHMVMKGLLFLAAGSVLHATGTGDLEQLGGLLRRMRWTGATFIAGAAAISSLPPLCGFVGEWIILSAGFSAAMVLPARWAVAVLLACLVLVLAAGLAAAFFARVVGIAFLGSPRSERAAAAHDPGPALVVPMAALAVCCVLLGLFPGAALSLVSRAAEAFVRSPIDGSSAATLAGLARLTVTGGIVLALVLLLLLVRRALGTRTRGSEPGTWGCGYSLPGPRLQYTASSFAHGLMRIFGPALAVSASETLPAGLFPAEVARRTDVPDRAERAWLRLFGAIARRLGVVRAFQSGKLNKYLLLMVSALVVGLLYAILSQDRSAR